MCVRACVLVQFWSHSDTLYNIVVTFKCISMITVYTALCNGDVDGISVRERSLIF